MWPLELLGFGRWEWDNPHRHLIPLEVKGLSWVHSFPPSFPEVYLIFGGVEERRIDSNKNVFVWEKLFPSMSKHIVWGKFMALAWSLISGCQKVLVWTKICCNKNALFWRNLLSPWKPIQFRKICWFQWKSICFKRQREGSCTQLRTRGFSQYRSPCSPLAIKMGKAGKSTTGQQRKPVGLACARWPSSQLKKNAPAPLG